MAPAANVIQQYFAISPALPIVMQFDDCAVIDLGA
jgi:hypothetical protein